MQKTSSDLAHAAETALKMFDKLDRNKDGWLSEAELMAAFSKGPGEGERRAAEYLFDHRKFVGENHPFATERTYTVLKPVPSGIPANVTHQSWLINKDQLTNAQQNSDQVVGAEPRFKLIGRLNEAMSEKDKWTGLRSISTGFQTNFDSLTEQLSGLCDV